ncbi:2OG-Fe dioxygenase family protein [Sphingobium sp. CR28]|uniref:2OG-Fe dioxygenase family protein n=1 Tax=Sphingobium sp. CR28 TaxID=3400272 RepID=UPI003FEF2DA0
MPSAEALEAIILELRGNGLIRLEAPLTLRLLGEDARANWESFGAFWSDLGTDLYMADGGRYRRRRYAAFTGSEEGITRKPHQPHYQSRDYNTLNGGVQRWFEPVTTETEHHRVTRSILALCAAIFAAAEARSGQARWSIEFHQFRIETSPDHIGRPTPEGLHRDGVDWVFVMLLRRENVRDGLTVIGAPDGTKCGSFLLGDPGDAVLLDDHRILHGVTEIHAVDPALPAYRDVLVVTFVRE